MYYFVSDVHLGLESGIPSSTREKLFVRWLDQVGTDAKAIFLAGDIFDFWHEYKHVVPKGFTRVLGKFAELTDRGVEIHHFAGNHDLWTGSYLEKECGVKLHPGPYEVMELSGKKVFIGHGDILGRRSVKSVIFRNKAARSLLYLLHPDTTLAFGLRWSRSSREGKPYRHTFRGEEEHIVKFAREHLANECIDLFVCGHIHCAEIYPLDENSAIAFLGDWIETPTYGVLDNEGRFTLKTFER